MVSDESHFNVSVGSDGQSHKTVSTNHNLSEEKGEVQDDPSFLLYSSFTANGNVLTEPMDMDCDEPAANSSSQYQQYSPPPSRLTVT